MDSTALDVELSILYEGYDGETGEGYNPCGIQFHIPLSTYNLVKDTEHIRTVMERAVAFIWKESWLKRLYNRGDLQYAYELKLHDVEADWKEVIKNAIVNSGVSKQALITEKSFSKTQKQPYIYNEIKFASLSEMRIAQEFEERGILFFPLPLAVRAETGNRYHDHREVDFLVCNDGIWGILEVSFHPDRFEKDAEKDTWFKKSGILCIQHYSAERCYHNSKEVVAEFLGILAKHKR